MRSVVGGDSENYFPILSISTLLPQEILTPTTTYLLSVTTRKNLSYPSTLIVRCTNTVRFNIYVGRRLVGSAVVACAVRLRMVCVSRLCYSDRYVVRPRTSC